MAQPVPVPKSTEVVKAFQRLGWDVARQRGSHIILTKEGSLATLSVPNHPEVARDTFRALIGRAGITVDGFMDALQQESRQTSCETSKSR